jgi:hypothetical protein
VSKTETPGSSKKIRRENVKRDSGRRPNFTLIEKRAKSRSSSKMFARNRRTGERDKRKDAGKATGP